MEDINNLDMDKAACKTADPDIFFIDTNNKDVVAEAKSYCGICPIVLQCLTYALNNEEHGIWGGTTMQERLSVRNNPKARKELIISVTTK